MSSLLQGPDRQCVKCAYSWYSSASQYCPKCASKSWVRPEIASEMGVTTNPFRLICADCNTPWRDGDKYCWNCGSSNYTQNPDFGQALPPPVLTPVRFNDPKQPDAWSSQSAALWVLGISAGIAVLIYFGVRDSMDYAWAYAFASWLVIAGQAWIICLIILTNTKVERIGRMLEEMSKRS